jgi:hypothetical protein
MEYRVIDRADEKTIMSAYHLDVLELLKKLSIPYKVKYADDRAAFTISIPEDDFDKFRQAKIREDLAPACENCGRRT